MAVREVQDEPALPQHIDEAAQCGIAVAGELTRGDLLSAVQTAIRAS